MNSSLSGELHENEDILHCEPSQEIIVTVTSDQTINNDVKICKSAANEVLCDVESFIDPEIQEMISEGLSQLGYPASGVSQVFLNITLVDKGLKTIDFLSSYEHLQVVNVSHNALTELDVLQNLYHLISLNASHNELEKIIDFNPPIRIREMNFSNNKIIEISDLSCHLSLNTLLLDNNDIEEINGIQDCKCLKVLSLSYNKITQICGLDGLPLQHLDLSYNEIKKIENIQNLKMIQYINISHNKIRSLRGLQDHNLLEDINLENNQVLDISEIRYLRDLRLLRIVNLSENPIQETIDYRLSTLFKLPMLMELDVIPVLPEEKVSANNLFNPSIELVSARDHMYNLMKYYQQSQCLLDSTLASYEPYPMLIITGPIGFGKKVLAKKLCQEFPTYFSNCIGHTTRDPSSNLVYGDMKIEEDGMYYHFMNVEEFERRRFEGVFIQTCINNGHHYGISRESIETVAQSGLACVITMELEGIMSFKQTHYEPRFVLLLPENEKKEGSRKLSLKSILSVICFLLSVKSPVCEMSGYSLNKTYKQMLHDSNRYTESQILSSIENVEVYIDTHRSRPGYFDATIVCDDFNERYEQLKKVVLDYLGLTLHNTSTSSSLSILSRKSTSGLFTREKNLHPLLCTLNNDSVLTVTDKESVLGRTAAVVSYERRFEDTKSAIMGMTSLFDEQILKVQTPFTPMTPNVIPYIEGYEDLLHLNEHKKSPTKSSSNLTETDDIAGQSPFNSTSDASIESSEYSVVARSDHFNEL